MDDPSNPSSAGPSRTTRQAVFLPSNPEPPVQVLTNDAIVSEWPQTPGFQGFWGWVKRRCERIKGKSVIRTAYEGDSIGIQTWVNLLDDMTKWVEEVPPEPQSAQRFGNLAFRKYIALVEERLPTYFVDSAIPKQLSGQLLPLLIKSTAFGQATRLDYGTGHELAFVLGLWCCVVSGWIGGEDKEEEEDELILRVFTKYLDLTTLLQKTYRLEPAGSHGVWGLDDYCFLPYLFGSAQLLDSDITPNQALQMAMAPSTMEEEITDLYTLSLHRIKLFKRGAAFSEHSPLLHSLSQMPNWIKPHSGLQKMFLGEVVGKRVVVQGLWIGGWCWGPDVPKPTRGVNHNPMGQGSDKNGTKAPWVR